MYYTFIVNPKSGMQALQSKISTIAKKLKADGHRVDIYQTSIEKNGYIISKFLPENVNLVVAVGGDGTVNEIVNGLFERKRPLPMAIIPAGTVNDFATHFKLPKNQDEIYYYLKNHEYIAVDIARANHTFFVNVIAAGFVAKVGHSIQKNEKKVWGKIAYYVSGLYTALSNWRQSNMFTVTIEGKRVSYNAYMFIAMNSSNLGGISHFAPNATCLDGYLDFYIIEKTGLIGGAILLMRLLMGKLIVDKHVVYRRVKKFSVEVDSPMISDIDGEEGEALPLTVELLPSALKLAIPL